MLHRDLKPGNILFDEQGRPYVSDFGLAKLASADSDLTRSMDFLGTPHYVAPEIAAQSARQATTASDIYSLGAILYELLTGRPPFEAEGVPALLKKITEDEPMRPSAVRRATEAKSEARMPKSERNPNDELRTGPVQNSNFGFPSDFGIRNSDLSVPRDLEVICLKCLAKEPNRRYVSARDLAEDLRRWLAGKPIAARPVSRAERTWKWVQRNPLLATLAAALLISLIGGGLALWKSNLNVRAALSTTQRAESRSQQSLHEALLAQAQALGAAHATGQRWQALDALARAARIWPSLELRNEAAAALARPDLREVKRFPAYFGEAGSSVVFTSDLERFIAPEPAGGFSVRATSNQTVLASFPGGQSKPARSFNLSPDDRQVAAVLGNYSLAVYPIEGGPPCLNWPGNAVQNACAGFHPRSAVIAGFIPGETLFLQDLTSSNRTSLGQSKGRVLFLQYDPSGNRLAVVRDGVEVWDCQGTPTLLWSQPSRKNTVPWLAWSPDASKLLTAADDGRGIRILTAANGQTEFVYSRHLLYPRQFEFHPNGRIIGSVGQDWVLRLWDARTGQDLVSGVGRHRVMRFSRDGRRLTTAPTDHELAVLELAPDLVFREFASASLDALPEVVPNGLACSTDGQLLLAVNPQVRLYDIRRGEQVAMLDPSASEQQAFFESNAPAILYSRLGRGIYRRQFACTTNSGTGILAIEWGDEQLINTHPGAIIWNTVEGGRTWVRHGNGGVELWPNHDPSQARRVDWRGRGNAGR